MQFKFKKRIKKVKSEMILIMGKAGSGKSTMMALLVRQAQKINRPIYCSHHVLGAIKIDAKDLGRYDLHDCDVIIDEAQLEYDNRDFKSFSKENKYFVSNFRHHNVRVFFLSQSFEDLDVKIRRQAQKIYIMQPFIKGILLLQKVRVKFGVSEDEREIITKYKSGLLDLRFKLGYPGWKYFDSYSVPDLPPKPIELWGTPPLEKSLFGKITALFSKKQEDIDLIDEWEDDERLQKNEETFLSLVTDPLDDIEKDAS